MVHLKILFKLSNSVEFSSLNSRDWEEERDLWGIAHKGINSQQPVTCLVMLSPRAGPRPVQLLSPLQQVHLVAEVMEGIRWSLSSLSSSVCLSSSSPRHVCFMGFVSETHSEYRLFKNIFVVLYYLEKCSLIISCKNFQPRLKLPIQQYLLILVIRLS